LNWLAEVGYDPEFGDRPLKRAIQREVQDSLALKILSGEFSEGETIKIELVDGTLSFAKAYEQVAQDMGNEIKKSDVLIWLIAFLCVISSGLEFYVDDFSFFDFYGGAIFCNRARSAIGGGAVFVGDSLLNH